MERSLLWSAFGVGMAGWLSALILTSARPREERSEAGRIPRAYWVTAIVLPVVLFVVTLPSRPPFAEGQGFGRGFVLGAVGALLGFLVAARARDRAATPVESALFAAAPLFLAVAATALALLWLPAVIIDVLVSLSIGWLTTSLILEAGQGSLGGESGARLAVAVSPLRPFTRSAVFATTLVATAALGIYRGSGTLEHFRWAAAAVILGAAVPLLIVVSAIPGRLFGWLALRLPFAGAIGRMAGGITGDEATRAFFINAWRIVLACALLSLVGWSVGAKFLGQSMVLRVVGIGLAMSLVAWWVVRDSGIQASSRSAESDQNARTPERRDASTELPAFALASLVILAGFMAAYRYLQGFGVGLALLAAWGLVGIAHSSMADVSGTSDKPDVSDVSEASASAPALAGLMTLGTILVLLRLFQTRFTHELRGVGLSDDYAMVGVLVGALLPGIVAGFQARGPLPPWLAIARMALSGALLLIVPAGIILLWGSKCALALLIGLALAAALEGWQTGFTPEAQRGKGFASLFALASALALTQWLDRALPLASLARAAKIGAVGWAVAGLAILILLTDYAGRLLAARRAGAAPAGAGR